MKAVVYKDEVNEWRWTVQADNGNTMGDSSEGYKNYDDCTHGLYEVTGVELGEVHQKAVRVVKYFTR